MVMHALGRLIMVPLGMVLAAFATLFVLTTLGLERATQAAQSEDWITTWFTTGIDTFLQGQFLASPVTLVPALALVAVGEVGRIRSALYYVFGGGVALMAVPFLVRLGENHSFATSAVWQVFATAGFAGGLVYWLIAGRRA
ncbi:MAG: hypothetical protein AAFR04_11225 [Pseudomonadota bacterium]